MDEILALQYRRRGRRLQILILPYSFNISGAALIRFLGDGAKDPSSGWRILPITGMSVTLRLEGFSDFDADVAIQSLFDSEWVSGGGTYLETKGLVDVSSWDFSDLIGGRVPSELVSRIHEQVDFWM